MMKSVEELQQIITKKVDGFCAKNGTGEIYQPINYILQLGGKRLRPVFTLMAANLFGDEIEDAVYPALAIEIFHNFTLMHDDIMDKAPTRRGAITVHEKWNTNVAILSGDAMMIQSYQLLMKTNPAKLPEIMRVFNQTALHVCEGQQQDMNFESRERVTFEEYEEMIRLKTSVLLAGAMQIGAIINGADDVAQQQLYDFAINLGLSFQLMDDYLDSFGDETKTGKQIGGDILSDKKTFLLIRAFETASPVERKTLEHYIGAAQSNPREKVEAVLAVYKTLHVEDDVRERAYQFHVRAMKLLDALNVDDHRKLHIRNLAEMISLRTH